MPGNQSDAAPRHSGQTDLELVYSIARGNPAALAEVYNRHGAQVHAVARRATHVNSADDVVQEVFLRFWRDPERYDPERGSLRSFLLVQAHSRAVDALRSNESRRTREAAAKDPSHASIKSVEGEVLETLAGEAVDAVLATLPYRERHAIELAYFGGRTYREVALLLDEPEGTIKSRIRRGLARLRAELAEGSADSSILLHG